MKIALIDYNAGNTTSVQNVLKRLGYSSELTSDPTVIRNADKVIFPGVGEASYAMKQLQARGLDLLIPELTQPFLGICLGMQLLCRHSEEGTTDCLNIFDANVRQFPANETVPHMGWNTVKAANNSLFRGIDSDADFYFVHSFYAEICQETSATCDYILDYSAALQKDNFYGVQFHPEKSADVGAQLINNFLSL